MKTTPTKKVVLRLTGRPSLERGEWMVKEDWTSIDITLPSGMTKAVSTGCYEGDREVWVPEGERDNWPPHHQRLINILTDPEEEEPTT